jgi:RNA polymerase subunit RPABC4/transcription elongation factor Spt4
MAKKKQECPSCAMMVDEGLDECPICGYEFPQPSSGIKWVAIALLLVLAGYFLIQFFR